MMPLVLNGQSYFQTEKVTEGANTLLFWVSGGRLAIIETRGTCLSNMLNLRGENDNFPL